MPEFEDLRERLREVRGQLESTGAAVRSVEDQLKRIEKAEADLARVFNPDVADHVAARQRLQEERRRVNAELKTAHILRNAAVQTEAELRAQFLPFSDPRTELPRLNDATPILLMPVRIETRFRTFFIPGPVPGHHFLLIRIYPDDCWIDTFDPRLSESEVASARAYWIGIWEAGGIERQERAAWQTVVRAYGAGRASWIVEAVTPSNLTAKPSKASPDDVVLVMVSDAPLPEREEAAAAAFWRDAWLSRGDEVKLTAARKALATAVGEARAAQIVEQLRPERFDVLLAEHSNRENVTVSAALLVLEPKDTRQQAWSGAPKITLLPDRFVFIGYLRDQPPMVAIGRPVPSTVFAGPDPSARVEEQLRLDDSGNLIFPDELAWIADFAKAAEIGLALSVELLPAIRMSGFERVIVLGVRMSADERTAQAELETLLRHHSFSRSGLTIVPQGTPTNNTDAVSSAAGRSDVADESFNDRRKPVFTLTPDLLNKSDGQWLSEALGIDPALFAHVHHSGAPDQSCERAMNIALWPATFGYWMEAMLAPVFPATAIELTRTFFTRYVVGCGTIPALRIGSQPYGILPATPIWRMQWFNQPLEGSPDDPLASHVGWLYRTLQKLQLEWSSLLGHVSYVGKSDGDPHQILLDILGLHSGSVEWASRYAESRLTLFNRLNLQGVAGAMGHMVNASQWVNAREELTRHGYQGADAPVVLDYLFAGDHNLLKGGVVDDRPLSEVDPVRAYTTNGANYLRWLIDAASTSLERLYSQTGFVDDKPPTALLYLLLRHALQLGYHDTSVRLDEQAGILTAAQAAAARIDQPILHVGGASPVSESRFQPLFAVRPEIVGAGSTATVAEFISTKLADLEPASHLREQIEAVKQLESQPTARLERAFADHVDCCSYRLDAWTLGLVNYQLATMRRTRETDTGAMRQGIYLGAYGWLEEVRPKEPPFSEPPPVVLDDPVLAAEFAREGDAPLVRDPLNQGFVHAPSLNHAVAAAVLRNGYISTATPELHDTLAVNLTSERMRTAMWLIDGIRAGQGLSDLLGYQFERGLHDRHGVAEVDKFIYPLRKAFPLRGDRMQSTSTPEGVPIEAIEARNVLDGLALVNHISASGVREYPFGKPELPAATPEEAAAITAEADRLLASNDAVADLAMAEGIYQAVLGNYDRAAANYDAYARGNLPPEPEIIRTPLSGIGLTHRVVVHLAAGADPNRSPEQGVPMTPRAQAEPAVNAWLAAMLPPLSKLACVVSYSDAATGDATTHEVTLNQIGIQPADLVAWAGSTQDAMSEIDDRVLDFAMATFNVRPDTRLKIRYMKKKTSPVSVFEVLPLIRHLRVLTSGVRPLRPSDLSLASEARSSQDEAPIVDRARVGLVESAMRGLADDIESFVARLRGPLSDPVGRRSELVAVVDAFASEASVLLARAALFGVPQTGREFVRDFRHRLFAGVLAQARGLVKRWTAQVSEFDARIAEHDALPASASEAERFRVLALAETAIATRPAAPRPATSAQVRTQLVETRRKAYVERRERFAAVKQTTRTRVADLMADVSELLPVTEFDPTPFSLDAHKQAIVDFVRQLRAIAASVGVALRARLAEAATEIAAHDASGVATDRARALETAAKALLGGDFVVVPEFAVPQSQRDEIGNALDASRSGALFEHLVHPSDPQTAALDFPVDTWLHGAARVRERLHAWEQMTVLTEAFGRAQPALDALQLPHVPGDRWIGLDLPADEKLDTDRLLYTAHFAAPFSASAHLCGLLLDEWTETIPGSDVDTGIALHHDRPNAEAPQAMLLVTPSEFRGAWQWNDLMDAVYDALDLAKRRAVEPAHVANLPLAPYLPATIMATQARELTIAANLAANNLDVRSGD